MEDDRCREVAARVMGRGVIQKLGMSWLMIAYAQGAHRYLRCECPLSGVKRT